jgi:hypothetical protein
MVAGGGARLSTRVFLELSLERVFGAVAGPGNAVGTVPYGVGQVAKLVGHGVVAGLTAFVRLPGTLAWSASLRR